MKEWQDLGQELRRYILPETSPVAVKLFKDRGEVPEDFRTPLKSMKVKMAHCQAAAVARKYGWTIAMSEEDLGCAISGYTYGWVTADPKGAVAFLTRMQYAADPEAARNMFSSLRTIEPGLCEAVAYSPLERTRIVPDVILLYLNPAQLMRCIHGSTRQSGLPLQCSFSGRTASCTEGVLGAFLDQAPKVVVPGNGDRVWATAQDHEMAYALPAAHLRALVEGLAKTHETGVRYPVPAFLKFQPEVGLSLPLTDIFGPLRSTRKPEV